MVTIDIKKDSKTKIFFSKYKRILCLQTRNLLRRIFLGVYNYLPFEFRWRRAQNIYSKWSKSKLPDTYFQQIIETGKNFSNFIGNPQLLLDVGCGNGVIGGLSYEEAGYVYLSPEDEDIIIGIDPLPLMGPKPPGYNEYVMAICENLPFRKVFYKISIATSLDHFQDPIRSLEECLLILIESLFIWTTCLEKATRDLHHPIRFTKRQLYEILEEAGFTIIKSHIFNKSKYGEEMFIEARRKRT